jgi:O-antigen/teichoic acid export membrane protein
MAQGAFFIPATGLQIAKRTSWLGWTAILAALLNVALNVFLVRPFEVFGVAAASLVSQTAATVFLFVVAQRIYPVPYHPGRVLLTFLLAIGLAALGLYFGRTGPAASFLWTAIALGLYLAGTLGLKVISVQDFVILRNYLRKTASARLG